MVPSSLLLTTVTLLLVEALAVRVGRCDMLYFCYLLVGSSFIQLGSTFLSLALFPIFCLVKQYGSNRPPPLAARVLCLLAFLACDDLLDSTTISLFFCMNMDSIDARWNTCAELGRN